MPESSNSPKLSILMTAFNRQQYIAEAIESVLASAFTHFELIIVDDKSTDSTVEIARAYAQKDNRIKFYINEKNLGDYPNRNRAASYATGDFLMNVDSDDMLFVDGMGRCVDAMSQFPQAVFGMCLHTEEKLQPTFIKATDAIQNHFFNKPILGIGPGGTIIKNSFFKSIGGYPEKYGPANDMYFNLKAAALGGVVMLPFEFIFYRIHAGQEINNHYAYLYHNFNYLKDALAELNLPMHNKQKRWLANKNKRRFLTNIARYLYQTGNIKKSFAAVDKAGYTIKDALNGIFH